MKKFMMAMLVGGCAVAHGQIVNGDFEQPRIPAETYPRMRVNAGEDTIPGWAVTFGSVDLTSQVHGVPQEQWLELNGGGPGEIQQTLSTTAGMRYRVELDSTSAADVENYRAYFLWNGVIHQRIDGSPSIQHFDRVIEAQGSDVLALRGVFQDSGGIFVDNITITQVPIDTPLTPIPEPTSYAVAAGIALMGWALWRKRSQI